MSRTGANLRAVVLGLEHPRALAVISSLGAIGVPIEGVDHEASARASSSRYVNKTHRVSADPAEALAFLVSLGEHGGGVLLPTSDEYVILVSQNAELLARHFVVTVPAWDVVGPPDGPRQLLRPRPRMRLKTPEIVKPRDEAELRSIVAGLDLKQHAYLLRTPAASVPADTRTDRFTKRPEPTPGRLRTTASRSTRASASSQSSPRSSRLTRTSALPLTWSSMPTTRRLSPTASAV